MFDCAWNGIACENNGALGNQATNRTVGSAGGSSLTTVGGTYAGLIFGEYANMVGVGGGAPVGDLFEQLTISFATGLSAGQTYNFYPDTDNSDFRLPPPNVVVPEPGTYALVAAGLAGLGFLRRRRRSASIGTR